MIAQKSRARYWLLPQESPAPDSVAQPKSASCTIVLPSWVVTKKFSGLISLWTNPCVVGV